jgi:hypothetical protein
MLSHFPIHIDPHCPLLVTPLIPCAATYMAGSTLALLITGFAADEETSKAQ